MILSNEIFVWEVGDSGKANWKIVDTTSGTAITGTLEIKLTSCSGASATVGFVCYGHKIYLASKGQLTNFSYTVSGNSDSDLNKNYTKEDLTECHFDNGYLYVPSENNGIVTLADDAYSIPYIVTNNSSMTPEEVYNWWYLRINHGAVSPNSDAFGYETVAGNKNAKNYQIKDIVYKGGQGAIAGGVRTVASNAGGVAVGLDTEAEGIGAVAAGYLTKAKGDDSVATGSMTVASGDHALAHGYDAIASGKGAVALGMNTKATGDGAIAEGLGSFAAGKAAHAEGMETYVSGDYSKASGYQSSATGDNSEAGGTGSEALGYANIAVGDHIRTHGKYQAGFGRWNDPGEVNEHSDIPDFLFMIGDGTDEEHRHNAFGVLNNGGFFYKGTDGEIHIFNEETVYGEKEDWWISRVERINDNKYEIEVTNGIDYFTSVWDVDWSDEDDVVWTSSTGQVIDMIGFDDTSDYRITEVEKIDETQYKMTAENKVGGKVVNVWKLTEDTAGKTTWKNTSAPGVDPVEIDFLNFQTDGEAATDLKDHVIKDSVSFNFIITDEENKVGKLRFNTTNLNLIHNKR